MNARGLAPWALIALVVLAFTPQARADEAQNVAAAEALYVQGTQLLSAGKHAEACPKLAESMRLDPSIGTGLYLADCYEKTRRAASAWATFRAVEDMATKANDHRADVAKRRADRLEPSLAKLTVVVPSSVDVDGLEVIRDQVIVGRPQWSAPVPVDAGPHVVRARAPHKKEWRTEIVVADGPGTTTVTVAALLDAPEEPPPQPWEPPRPLPPPLTAQEDRGKGQRIAGLAVAGAGLVTTAVGLVVGLNAKSIYDASNEQDRCTPDNQCDPDGTARRNNAFAAARAATITTIVGGAVVGTGLVLFLTAPRAPAPFAVRAAMNASGASLGLDGRF